MYASWQGVFNLFGSQGLKNYTQPLGFLKDLRRGQIFKRNTNFIVEGRDKKRNAFQGQTFDKGNIQVKIFLKSSTE